MGNNIILTISNVSKQFGGTQALKDVSFNLFRGEIHALLGENGAGKSTLVKIISGVVPKDSGEIIFEDEILRVKNPLQARNKGINVVYQELSLIPSLSVAENIAASIESMNTFKRMKLNNLKEESLSILKMLSIDPSTLVKKLGIGAQQMVEIAGAISRKCKLLILDEPTASLTKEEVEELFKLMHMLKKENVTIVYISHKLSEVCEIADRVTILKDGKFISTLEVDEIQEKKIIELMVGRDLAEMYPAKASNKKDKIFEVKKYSGEGFSDISFHVNRGEIVGFAGLAGAGRTELFTTIFGMQKPYSGESFLSGKKLSIRTPKDAMQAGIGYLPEDRKQDGIFMEMNIKENTIAATIDQICNKGLINRKVVEKNTLEMINTLNTKVRSIDDTISALSGGNQQKVILSRWLLSNPILLIVDEPTRGIDMGAKYEIYQLLRKLAEQGIAIIIISSELPEIIGMCDRAIAMYKGSIFIEANCIEPDFEKKIGYGIMGLKYTDEQMEILL